MEGRNKDGTFAKGNKIGKIFKENNPGGPGRPKKLFSKILDEFLELKKLEGHIVLTSSVGKVIEKKFSLESKIGDIKELIAVKLIQKAIAGDLRAIQEILDRVDGKPKQTVDNLSSDRSHAVRKVYNITYKRGKGKGGNARNGR